MARTLRNLTLLALFTGVLGCGGRDLDTPESLVIDEYPASTAFTVTFVMRSCSDTCSTYEPAVCTVEQGEEGNTLTFDISVPYDDKEGTDPSTLEGCSLLCGPPVLAHCSVPALAAGTWTLEADGFTDQITVR